jgi:hypothetical protein
LHNKPHACGASVASAAGPFTAKKKAAGFMKAEIMEYLTVRACHNIKLSYSRKQIFDNQDTQNI